MLFVDGETVDHAVALVLFLHRLQHAGYDGSTCCVPIQKVVPGFRTALDDGSPFFRQFLLIGLGIIIQRIANNTLTVANHPNLSSHPTEDDCAGCESLLWMAHQPFYLRVLVLFANLLCDSYTEFVATDVLWRFPNEAFHQLHGIAAIALEKAVATVCLRCRTINDGYEVRSDDDSVLAFYLWVLRNDVLLYYFHCNMILMGDRVEVCWGRVS